MQAQSSTGQLSSINGSDVPSPSHDGRIYEKNGPNMATLQRIVTVVLATP